VKLGIELHPKSLLKIFRLNYQKNEIAGSVFFTCYRKTTLRPDFLGFHALYCIQLDRFDRIGLYDTLCVDRARSGQAGTTTAKVLNLCATFVFQQLQL
jgi:hypothetical protein